MTKLYDTSRGLVFFLTYWKNAMATKRDPAASEAVMPKTEWQVTFFTPDAELSRGDFPLSGTTVEMVW